MTWHWIYRVPLYYLSWLVFGLVSIGLNLVCLVLLLLPNRRRYGRSTRRAIHGLFGYWLKWLHLTRIVLITWHGFDKNPIAPGSVLVCNHPSLVDATFLLGRLPDTLCVFKPSLMRNPTVGPAALMAGYVSGTTGVEVIRDAATKIATGPSLLIFPEGTRTQPGLTLGPIKSGFALIAQRAHAPVRLITMVTTAGFSRRGRGWWKLPVSLPILVGICLDEETWWPDPGRPAAELATRVVHKMSEQLSGAVV